MSCINKPSILVVSGSDTKPQFLVELITQNSVVIENDPHRISQSWTIDTKYYTADVDIHGITEHYQRSDEFNEAVKALVIYMDCEIESGLTNLSKWEAIQNECNPEIKLLVSNYCNEQTKIKLTKVTEWCLSRGFEFIVLYPDKNDVEDEIIKEKVGVDRIVEALQTYIWPNLVMKDVDKMDKNVKNKLLNDEQSSSDKLFDDTSAHDGMDDFTELFAQLHMMKQSIQSLSGIERKQCAEQMVTAFWKAIDGDDEELEDL